AALDALELADALSSLLPADQAKKVRAELGELGGRVIRITTVVEKMSYDKDVVAGRAGKPVGVRFWEVELRPPKPVVTKPRGPAGGAGRAGGGAGGGGDGGAPPLRAEVG